MRSLLSASLLSLLLPAAALAQSPGNRLAYLDECNPYYPSRTFPKLITPQWVGEEGVEAVVILAIDDMRDPKRYEAFLRPILRRLKQIDGRAPVSIMTNSVKPDDPQLQTWLKEGLSLETHTLDHPCPFFKGGSFAKAKETYDKCVDLLASVPNSKPVAFRMPCCDSLNTPSPRFYAEIFNKTTAKGNFLSIDTSVFNVFTANDPELPRELVQNPDGSERFRRYLPADRSFVNTIEDYPYPYVIDRLCWEFPCVTPSDWQAQHIQKPNNPQTVRDWKAALDCTVIKQGVFCLVFHPHGWIKNDQIVELIDHAVQKHGKKVKFLNFREALERLNKNLLGGQTLRHPKYGDDNGARLLDLNSDGHLDVIVGNRAVRETRLWSPKKREWSTSEFVLPLSTAVDGARRCFVYVGQFGFLRSNEYPSLMLANRFWHFDGKRWVADRTYEAGLETDKGLIHTTTELGGDTGVRLRDLDGDGLCEIVSPWGVFAWSKEKKHWRKLPFALPALVREPQQGKDNGLRFVDLDADGHDDIIFSNENEYGIYLFKDMKTGWSRKVMAGKRGDKDALPMISRNGTNNGFWVHSGYLWWSNEDTPLLKDHVDRRNIKQLLGNDEQPGPMSPEQSLRSIKTRPGFQVDLVAAEPLVQSPIAFAWGADGKLWVVEMGDYPLGVDGKGKPGGRIKFLEDTKGTGKYDKVTVFMDNLPFPTGVMPWGKGVLVTCAPEIFYAEDTDGDGKADKKVVLYTGFVEGNQQHRVNSLVYGLDNWIYCANGDSGGRVVSVKTGKVVNISGRDFRIRPETGDIELESGQTQYGRSRDDWGNWFGGNNSNPMWHYVLDDHYLRRNPHLAPPTPRVPVSVAPGAAPVYPTSRTLPRFNDPHAYNRFTSACSPIVYRDDLFGPAFAGNCFISEPVHNLVHREVMEPKGVTFTSRRAADEQTSEFLAAGDNWFRPTMIQTGPDGALWVADMYRHVIEHPQWIPKEWQAKLDLRAGHDKGRIYRVYPVGTKPRAIPRLDTLDTAGLVAALDSPSGWQRDTAQQLLVAKKDKAAVPLLEKLARASKNPLARLHALCTLDGLGALDLKLNLVAALNDRHPGVRRHSVRLLEPRLKDIQGNMFAVIVDAERDPQVRIQWAYSLGFWKDPQAGNLLGLLALKDSGDPYMLAAVLSSVTKDNLEPMLLTVLAESKTKAPPAKLLDSLLRMATAMGNKEATVSLLRAVGTPEKGKYAPWQFSALAGFLDTLDRGNSSLTKLARAGDADLKKQIQSLSGLFAAARAAVKDDKAAQAERVVMLRLLGRDPDRQQEDLKALAGLLVPQTAEELQAAAIAQLGRLHDPQVPGLLLRGWKRYGPGLRTQALDALLARADWMKAVLDAVEGKKILPFEIDAARRQRLLDSKNAALRKRAATLLAGAVSTDRHKVVDSYRPALKLTGDAGRGQAVFKRTCAACHKLGGIGQEVGPDLAALRDKSGEALLIAILDPNQAVEARYISYLATTKNGLTYTGLLASETGNSITLIGADGKKHDILRSELEDLVSTGKSTMPEGLEKDINVNEMGDLLAFLRAHAPQPKRKALEGDRMKRGFPGAGKGVIYGPTMVLEKHYGLQFGHGSAAVEDPHSPTPGPLSGRRPSAWGQHSSDVQGGQELLGRQDWSARLPGHPEAGTPTDRRAWARSRWARGSSGWCSARRGRFAGR
jgi:putative membrane-bound dehydrogenase-like protein